MDAATTPEKDTLNRMIASRFRRPLTATGALRFARNPWHGCSCVRQRPAVSSHARTFIAAEHPSQLRCD
jgi:hypothetical protein